MSFDLDKALSHRVVLLSGEEDSLRRRALRDLLASPAVDEFDLEQFQAGDSGPGAWYGAVATTPFMGERRVAVARNVLRLEDPADALKSNSLDLSALPDTALLILVADEEPGDDNRQRKLTSVRKSWEKLVSAAKGLIVSFDADAKKIVETIHQEARRYGKTISGRAAELLAEMTGGSVSRSIEEMEKLALYVGDEPQIRESDVTALVIPSREWSIFALVDAVVEGDAASALRQLRIVMGSAAKAEETAFRSILPMLSRQFRLLWQARMCLDAKVDPASAPADLVALMPDRPKLATEKEFVRRRVMGSARRLDFVKLQRCMSELSDCDARLKGLLPSFSGQEALEQMVLRMVEVTAPEMTGRR